MKTEYLLQCEVDRVLSALTPVNQAVCKVALHTGLRVGDVLRLRTSDIKRVFTVKEQKTGKYKRCGLTDELIALVLQTANDQWAFPGRSPDAPRTRQAVWKDVKRAAKAFRLPQNIAPHSFRKVYAVSLLDKYGDIERVRRALNHSDFATTMIYAASDKLLTQRLKSRKKRLKFANKRIGKE